MSATLNQPAAQGHGFHSSGSSTRPLRYALLTSGSRGDVQPFLALARGLRQAGFDVSLVTHEPFREFVSAAGVPFRSLGGDPRAMLNSPAGRELLATGENTRLFFRRLFDLAEPYVVDVARTAVTAVEDADVLLCSTAQYFVGEALAERFGKPMTFLSLQPMAPTREQPGVFQKPLPRRLRFLERWGFHRIAQTIGLQVYAYLYRRISDRVRQDVLELPRRSRWFRTSVFVRGPLFLYGYSTHVVPRPSDWADSQRVCGYWMLPAPTDWVPSERLLEFLDAGSAPVYIGFGSMPTDDPVAKRRLILEVLEATGQRAIVARGWGGLDAADWPDHVFAIDAVPHDWLFTRMAAVVHHGGAGTTATGLTAGRPTVVVPHIADQPYWGRRVQELGAGPAPISHHRLSAAALSEAIRQAVNDPVMRSRAETLGRKLRAEDGIQTAVEHLRHAVPR